MVEIIKKDYKSMTDEEVSAEMITDYKAKKAVEADLAKVNAFNTAKESAFQELAQAQDTEKQALAQVWQTAEDNEYTIPK